ncbi:DUF3798 domain-containing protein [Metaclostridioides mangenotii]|uniref:DUF3798 domain-containing protein n=1 Tax=Metaclostridioides mangenotii TaxID=1540 RepID=UPI0004AF32D3|nr:DUF3798 domain-containing protein [Clostridioides mangenotii]
MFKKVTALLMTMTLVVMTSGCSMLTKNKNKKEEVKDFKVIVFTESKNVNKNQYDAVNTLIKDIKKKKLEEEEKGKKNPKQEIIHEVLPMNFEKNPSETEKKIEKLAKDKTVQAFVIATEEPGLLPALKNVKKKRPEVITMSAPMGESVNDLSEYVDVNLGMNPKQRAISMVKLAKKLGAKTFVHYSTPQDLTDKKILERKDQIKIACKDEQIGFVEIGLPNYTNDQEKEVMKDFLEKNIESQVNKFGKEINVFGANEDLDTIILDKAKDLKYIVAEQSTPNPSKSYPEVMGFKVAKKDEVNYEKLNDKISEGAKNMAYLVGLEDT